MQQIMQIAHIFCDTLQEHNKDSNITCEVYSCFGDYLGVTVDVHCKGWHYSFEADNKGLLRSVSCGAGVPDRIYVEGSGRHAPEPNPADRLRGLNMERLMGAYQKAPFLLPLLDVVHPCSVIMLQLDLFNGELR